jgi:PAS domain S-box-containing protein
MRSEQNGLPREHRVSRPEPRVPSAIAEGLPALIRRSDAEGRCTYVNRAWLSLTGRQREEQLGYGWAEVVHPEDRARCLELLRGARQRRQPVTLEYRLQRRDGLWRRLEEQAAPPDPGDGLGGLLHAAFDITERQADREHLQQLLDRQQVSLRELRHRAMNRSQMILSLLRLQAGDADDPAARCALEAAANRVQALMLADQRLDTTQHRAEPRLDECLQELAEALRPSFEERAIRLEVSLDEVELPVGVAAPLGLLVNELLMNSLKHAFPESRAGTVRLLGTNAGGRLQLLVADDGIGLPEHLEPRRARSSGMRLIEALANQIRAEVMVEREPGTCFALTVPLD